MELTSKSKENKQKKNITEQKKTISKQTSAVESKRRNTSKFVINSMQMNIYKNNTTTSCNIDSPALLPYCFVKSMG